MPRKPMTEEEKKLAAERLAKARAEKKAKAEAESEPVTVRETAKVVQVVEREPTVKILYIDSALPDNQIPIGKGSFITGSGRIFSKPLSEFEGEFMTSLVIALIKERKFIVLDGLTDEQRIQYNCLYKEGEVIRGEGMFDFFFNCDINKAKELFSALCVQHREMVGKRFIEAYEAHDNRITRDVVEALNEISKKDYADGKGVFTPILQDMLVV